MPAEDDGRITCSDVTILRKSLQDGAAGMRRSQALAQGIEDHAMAAACGRQLQLLAEVDEFLLARSDIAALAAADSRAIRIEQLPPLDQRALGLVFRGRG